MKKQVMTFINQLPDTTVEAHIADLHFGVIDPELEYKILYEQFIIPLQNMNILDIVSVNGDIFDHKFMANSNAVIYALKFIYDIADICKAKNSTLILISGTGSHDADQLKIFTPLLDDPLLDIRIIFDVQFVYAKGKKILCIPEVYNKGFDYYMNFLFHCGTYDACYMHGTFVGAIHGKNQRDLNEVDMREPVFDMDCFGLCKGPIISGHVHTANIYKKHFYYSGSPIRWIFGEEKEKGFIILVHNYKIRQYMIHFEPIKSFRYDTVSLDQILNQPPEHIIRYIDNLKASGIDYLRLVITKDDQEKINLLKTYYKNNNTIKFKTDYKRMEIDRKLEEMDDKYKEYDYIFTNISPEEKFVRYVNQETNSTYWTVDLFKDFLQRIERI